MHGRHVKLFLDKTQREMAVAILLEVSVYVVKILKIIENCNSLLNVRYCYLFSCI